MVSVSNPCIFSSATTHCRQGPHGIYRSLFRQAEDLSVYLDTAWEVVPGVVCLPLLLLGKIMIIIGVIIILPVIQVTKSTCSASFFVLCVWSKAVEICFGLILLLRGIAAQVVRTRVDTNGAFHGVDIHAGISSVRKRFRYALPPPLVPFRLFFRRMPLQVSGREMDVEAVRGHQDGRMQKKEVVLQRGGKE